MQIALTAPLATPAMADPHGVDWATLSTEEVEAMTFAAMVEGSSIAAPSAYAMVNDSPRSRLAVSSAGAIEPDVVLDLPLGPVSGPELTTITPQPNRDGLARPGVTFPGLSGSRATPSEQRNVDSGTAGPRIVPGNFGPDVDNRPERRNADSKKIPWTAGDPRPDAFQPDPAVVTKEPQALPVRRSGAHVLDAPTFAPGARDNTLTQNVRLLPLNGEAATRVQRIEAPDGALPSMPQISSSQGREITPFALPEESADAATQKSSVTNIGEQTRTNTVIVPTEKRSDDGTAGQRRTLERLRTPGESSAFVRASPNYLMTGEIPLSRPETSAPSLPPRSVLSAPGETNFAASLRADKPRGAPSFILQEGMSPELGRLEGPPTKALTHLPVGASIEYELPLTSGSTEVRLTDSVPTTLKPASVSSSAQPHLATTRLPEPPASLEPSMENAEQGLPETRMIEGRGGDIRASADAPFPRPERAAALLVQIADSARGLANGPVELSLSPEELGRVRMSLTGSEASMTVQILVERPETLELLRRNIEMLSAELRDQGYSDIAFSFGFGGDHGHGSDGQEQDTISLMREAETIARPDAPAAVGKQNATAAGLDLRL